MGSVPVGRKKRADTASGPQTFRSPTAVIVWWVWLLFAAANLIDLAVQGRDHTAVVAAAILVLATGIAYVTAQRPRIIADSAGVTVVNPLRDHHIGWAGVTKVDLADLLRVHTQGQPGLGREKVIHAWAVHYSRRRKIAAEAKARRTSARTASGRGSFGTFGLGGGYGSGSYGTGGYSGSGRSDLGYGRAQSGEAASAAEAEAERIARILGEYATAARAEAVWSDGTVEIAGASPAAGIEGGIEADAETNAEASETGPADIEPAGNGAADLRVTGWLEPLKSTWDRTALLALIIPALILLVVALV